MQNDGYRNNYYLTLWEKYWLNNSMNSETAIQIALSRVPGQVIKVESDYEDGFLIYEITILTTDGVYEVNVSATTGQILKIEREDN